MKIEHFISGIKHPEPSRPQEMSLDIQTKELVGRDRVIKTFKKLRPKTPVIDELLHTHGL